jgi:hypothetical protein
MTEFNLKSVVLTVVLFSLSSFASSAEEMPTPLPVPTDPTALKREAMVSLMSNWTEAAGALHRNMSDLALQMSKKAKETEDKVEANKYQRMANNCREMSVKMNAMLHDIHASRIM